MFLPVQARPSVEGRRRRNHSTFKTTEAHTHGIVIQIGLGRPDLRTHRVEVGDR